MDNPKRRGWYRVDLANLNGSLPMSSTLAFWTGERWISQLYNSPIIMWYEVAWMTEGHPVQEGWYDCIVNKRKSISRKEAKARRNEKDFKQAPALLLWENGHFGNGDTDDKEIHPIMWDAHIKMDNNHPTHSYNLNGLEDLGNAVVLRLMKDYEAFLYSAPDPQNYSDRVLNAFTYTNRYYEGYFHSPHFKLFTGNDPDYLIDICKQRVAYKRFRASHNCKKCHNHHCKHLNAQGLAGFEETPYICEGFKEANKKYARKDK